MTRTLLVFDLDGTLMNTRAGRVAFNRAFERVCGLASAAAQVPGVLGLVDHLHDHGAFTMALGTGNVEEGARLKLEPHGLNRYFPVGGFGSDGPTRNDLIAAAIARAEARQGGPFRQRVVIGDTPHDIACGKAHGCRTIAVATGPYSADALAQHRPDLLLENFMDMERFLDAVGNW